MRINTYKGKNYAYIFREDKKGSSAEIIFKDLKEEIEIKRRNYIFNKLDSMDTLNRKRLTLINFDFNTIEINNKPYNLIEIIHSNCGIKASSYQISVFSLEQEVFSVKPIFENEPVIHVDLLKSLKDSIKDKSSQFEKCLDIEEMEKYKNAINKLKTNVGISKDVLMNFMKMNLPKNYLENLFEENKWINLDIYYDILILNSLFLLDQEKLEKKVLIKNFLELIKLYISKLKEDEELKLFQKIQIIINIFMCINYIKDEKELLELNIRYYTFSSAEKDSILFQVKKFFNELISKISEESLIFKQLLYINSGHGYCKFNPIYTFDLLNADMIKEHLKDIFPEALIFFNSSTSNTLAFHHSPGGGISINEYKVIYEKFKIKDIDYNKNTKIKDSDNIAMNIVLNLFHEYMGHKKYHSGFLQDYDKISSPKKYINDDNEIIELKYIKSSKINVKNCDFILSDNNSFKGDSGHFLELCFGKINNKLVFSYLNSFNDNGNLLKRPDLFSDKTGETLKKYADFKYQCKKKNISLNITNDMSIENEIQEMEEKLNSKIYKRNREEDKDSESILTSYSMNKKKKVENELQSLYEEDTKNIESENEDSQEIKTINENNKMKKLRKIEKKMAKKFNLKLDATFVRQISQKLKDPNICLEDSNELAYLFYNYSIQE